MKTVLAAAVIAALPLAALADVQTTPLVSNAAYTFSTDQADAATDYVILAKGHKGGRGGGRGGNRSGRSIGKKLQNNHKINPSYGSKKSYGTVFVKRPDYSKPRVTRRNTNTATIARPFFLSGLFGK